MDFAEMIRDGSIVEISRKEDIVAVDFSEKVSIPQKELDLYASTLLSQGAKAVVISTENVENERNPSVQVFTINDSPYSKNEMYVDFESPGLNFEVPAGGYASYLGFDIYDSKNELSLSRTEFKFEDYNGNLIPDMSQASQVMDRLISGRFYTLPDDQPSLTEAYEEQARQNRRDLRNEEFRFLERESNQMREHYDDSFISYDASKGRGMFPIQGALYALSKSDYDVVSINVPAGILPGRNEPCIMMTASSLYRNDSGKNMELERILEEKGISYERATFNPELETYGNKSVQVLIIPEKDRFEEITKSVSEEYERQKEERQREEPSHDNYRGFDSESETKEVTRKAMLKAREDPEVHYEENERGFSYDNLKAAPENSHDDRIFVSFQRISTEGLKVFDRDKFEPIQNTYDKPNGGIWCCPIESNDWASTEAAEQSWKSDPNTALIFKIDGPIKTIDRAEDLLDTSFSVGDYGYVNLDFESLRDAGYAAVAINYGINEIFARYDCPSVIVLNPDAVKEITREEREKALDKLDPEHKYGRDLRSEAERREENERALYLKQQYQERKTELERALPSVEKIQTHHDYSRFFDGGTTLIDVSKDSKDIDKALEFAAIESRGVNFSTAINMPGGTDFTPDRGPGILIFASTREESYETESVLAKIDLKGAHVYTGTFEHNLDREFAPVDSPFFFISYGKELTPEEFKEKAEKISYHEGLREIIFENDKNADRIREIALSREGREPEREIQREPNYENPSEAVRLTETAQREPIDSEYPEDNLSYEEYYGIEDYDDEDYDDYSEEEYNRYFDEMDRELALREDYDLHHSDIEGKELGVLVSYSRTRDVRFFDSEKFTPIKNDPYFSKPLGGLWCCQVNSNDWVRTDASSLWNTDPNNALLFKIEGPVKVITSREDLDGLDYTVNPDNSIHLNFESLRDAGYAAVSIEYGINSLFQYYDCPSIIVLNPDSVREITREEREKALDKLDPEHKYDRDLRSEEEREIGQLVYDIKKERDAFKIEDLKAFTTESPCYSYRGEQFQAFHPEYGIAAPGNEVVSAAIESYQNGYLGIADLSFQNPYLDNPGVIICYDMTSKDTISQMITVEKQWQEKGFDVEHITINTGLDSIGQVHALAISREGFTSQDLSNIIYNAGNLLKRQEEKEIERFIQAPSREVGYSPDIYYKEVLREEPPKELEKLTPDRNGIIALHNIEKEKAVEIASQLLDRKDAKINMVRLEIDEGHRTDVFYITRTNPYFNGERVFCDRDLTQIRDGSLSPKTEIFIPEKGQGVRVFSASESLYRVERCQIYPNATPFNEREFANLQREEIERKLGHIFQNKEILDKVASGYSMICNKNNELAPARAEDSRTLYFGQEVAVSPFPSPERYTPVDRIEEEEIPNYCIEKVEGPILTIRSAEDLMKVPFVEKDEKLQFDMREIAEKGYIAIDYKLNGDSRIFLTPEAQVLQCTREEKDRVFDNIAPDYPSIRDYGSLDEMRETIIHGKVEEIENRIMEIERKATPEIERDFLTPAAYDKIDRAMEYSLKEDYDSHEEKERDLGVLVSYPRGRELKYMDPDKFLPIKNDPTRSKPYGGLWCCQVSSNDWTTTEASSVWNTNPNNAFLFKVEGPVKFIRDEEDLRDLSYTKDSEGYIRLDFETLRDEGYAAISIEYGINYYFRDYDCPSVIVLNPDSIREITREEREKALDKLDPNHEYGRDLRTEEERKEAQTSHDIAKEKELYRINDMYKFVNEDYRMRDIFLTPSSFPVFTPQYGIAAPGNEVMTAAHRVYEKGYVAVADLTYQNPYLENPGLIICYNDENRNTIENMIIIEKELKEKGFDIEHITVNTGLESVGKIPALAVSREGFTREDIDKVISPLKEDGARQKDADVGRFLGEPRREIEYSPEIYYREPERAEPDLKETDKLQPDEKGVVVLKDVAKERAVEIAAQLLDKEDRSVNLVLLETDTNHGVEFSYIARANPMLNGERAFCDRDVAFEKDPKLYPQTELYQPEKGQEVRVFGVCSGSYQIEQCEIHPDAPEFNARTFKEEQRDLIIHELGHEIENREDIDRAGAFGSSQSNSRNEIPYAREEDYRTLYFAEMKNTRNLFEEQYYPYASIDKVWPVEMSRYHLEKIEGPVLTIRSQEDLLRVPFTSSSNGIIFDMKEIAEKGYVAVDYQFGRDPLIALTPEAKILPCTREEKDRIYEEKGLRENERDYRDKEEYREEKIKEKVAHLENKDRVRELEKSLPERCTGNTWDISREPVISPGRIMDMTAKEASEKEIVIAINMPGGTPYTPGQNPGIVYVYPRDEEHMRDSVELSVSRDLDSKEVLSSQYQSGWKDGYLSHEIAVLSVSYSTRELTPEVFEEKTKFSIDKDIPSIIMHYQEEKEPLRYTDITVDRDVVRAEQREMIRLDENIYSNDRAKEIERSFEGNVRISEDKSQGIKAIDFDRTVAVSQRDINAYATSLMDKDYDMVIVSTENARTGQNPTIQIFTRLNERDVIRDLSATPLNMTPSARDSIESRTDVIFDSKSSQNIERINIAFLDKDKELVPEFSKASQIMERIVEGREMLRLLPDRADRDIRGYYDKGIREAQAETREKEERIMEREKDTIERSRDDSTYMISAFDLSYEMPTRDTINEALHSSSDHGFGVVMLNLPAGAIPGRDEPCIAITCDNFYMSRDQKDIEYYLKEIDVPYTRETFNTKLESYDNPEIQMIIIPNSEGPDRFASLVYHIDIEEDKRISRLYGERDSLERDYHNPDMLFVPNENAYDSYSVLSVVREAASRDPRISEFETPNIYKYEGIKEAPQGERDERVFVSFAKMNEKNYRVFDEERFNPVRNDIYKPYGGLWGCDVEKEGWRNSEPGFYDWNKDPNKALMFKIDGPIKTIDRPEDFRDINFTMSTSGDVTIDVEALRNAGYAAVEINYGFDSLFYGYECPSILVLDPSAVKEVTREEREKALDKLDPEHKYDRDLRTEEEREKENERMQQVREKQAERADRIEKEIPIYISETSNALMVDLSQQARPEIERAMEFAAYETSETCPTIAINIPGGTDYTPDREPAIMLFYSDKDGLNPETLFARLPQGADVHISQGTYEHGWNRELIPQDTKVLVITYDNKQLNPDIFREEACKMTYPQIPNAERKELVPEREFHIPYKEPPREIPERDVVKEEREQLRKMAEKERDVPKEEKDRRCEEKVHENLTVKEEERVVIISGYSPSSGVGIKDIERYASMRLENPNVDVVMVTRSDSETRGMFYTREEPGTRDLFSERDILSSYVKTQPALDTKSEISKIPVINRDSSSPSISCILEKTPGYTIDKGRDDLRSYEDTRVNGFSLISERREMEVQRGFESYSISDVNHYLERNFTVNLEHLKEQSHERAVPPEVRDPKILVERTGNIAAYDISGNIATKPELEHMVSRLYDGPDNKGVDLVMIRHTDPETKTPAIMYITREKDFDKMTGSEEDRYHDKELREDIRDYAKSDEHTKERTIENPVSYTPERELRVTIEIKSDDRGYTREDFEQKVANMQERMEERTIAREYDIPLEKAVSREETIIHEYMSEVIPKEHEHEHEVAHDIGTDGTIAHVSDAYLAANAQGADGCIVDICQDFDKEMEAEHEHEHDISLPGFSD